MNRRDFARTLFGTALGAATLQQGAFRTARTKSQEGQESAVSFKLSVMLWTVFRNQPFEERLEKVVEAGYQGVELVANSRNGRRRTSEKPTAGNEHSGSPSTQRRGWGTAGLVPGPPGESLT